MMSPPRSQGEPVFPFPVVIHKPLSELSTFKIGGPARYFTEVTTIEQMRQVLRFCRENHLRYQLVGKGSNSLFDDRGFDGLVVASRLDFVEYPTPLQVRAGAGYSFSRLGAQTARNGLTGLEFASGIPGSVGGAVYMNAGANGGDVACVLALVDFIDGDGNLQTFARKELTFGYRTSVFQKMRGAIVAATFTLTPDPDARQRQITIVDYRKRTQPYTQPSAGCVFRNPGDGCQSAGALIEQSGLKGMRLGGAQVSDIHANFIVNSGSASAAEVRQLMALVQETVCRKAGVSLESEVLYVPYGDAREEG